MRAPVLTLSSRLLALIVSPVAAVKAAMARRRIVGHLASFDDHLLRDIGLTRGDVTSAMAGSLLEDPTQRLAHMAYEARAGRRASAREQFYWANTVADTAGSADAKLDRRAA